MNLDDLSSYDYELPPELIAQHPLPRRDASRLMVVERRSGAISHRRISDLPELLTPGDCLVFNDTRVVRARLFGERESTGGKWEGLYLGTSDSGQWRLIGQTRGRLREGERIVVHPAAGREPQDPLILTLLSRDDEGVWTVQPDSDESPVELLERYGEVPLPPYISRERSEPDDVTRYQTVYAKHAGAVAAPTAGLHFTPELLETIDDRGIRTAFVTLHVGVGTFRPIAVPNLAEHRMHAEWCRLSSEVAEQLNETRANGGRIIAVGTTAVRTLESAVRDRRFSAWEGETDLFIRPPYQFQAIDGLVTNFHLPKSSLLVLVSAFLGYEETQRAYNAAVGERYRFFSYGDAMAIL